MRAHRLRDEIGGIAADLRQVARPAQAELVGAGDFEVDLGLAHVVEREGLVEQADERAERTGGVVVLGDAQQERAAALDVAQIDVVAEGRADDLSLGADDQRHLGLGIVPVGVRPDADLGTVADGGHGRRLGEDLGIGADTDFEVGRPGAARHQRLLQRLGLGRAGFDGAHVGADDRVQFAAHLLGAGGIALGVLLDQAFEQADGESDAGRFQGLQVDRRQQVAHEVLQGADAFARRVAREARGIGRVAEIGHRRDGRGEVEHAVAPQRHDRRPGRRAGAPDAADQGARSAVFGQDFAERW